MEVMMKELGEIITGNTPSKKTEAFWSSEDICFIKPDIIADDGINEIVDSNEYISENARKKARIVGKNSIFITCIGSIGKIGIASDGEYAFNQQINAIIPNDRVQPKYLAYNLLFNKPRFVAIANAPVVPIINKSQFGEFTVNIETDIDRQCEIVDVLDKFTQIIQQRNKEISALDELIKARFVEMFEKGNHEIVKASEICDFITKGTTPTTGEIAEEYNDGKIPFLKVYNLSFTGEMLFENNPQYIPKETHDGKLARSKVYPNDVLMNIVGPPLGKFALVTDEFDEWNINQAIAIFRAKDRILPRFLLHALMQPKVLEPFIGQAVGIRQQNLSLEQCRSLQIPLPSLEEQQSFVEFAKQVDKSKVKVQKALDETQKLFDSLMQQYFG
nr:restriction endonuclease subunit S [uncultured Blautia sp.]